MRNCVEEERQHNESKSSRWSAASRAATLTDTVSCCSVYIPHENMWEGQTQNFKKADDKDFHFLFMIQSHTAATPQTPSMIHHYVLITYCICFLNPSTPINDQSPTWNSLTLPSHSRTDCHHPTAISSKHYLTAVRSGSHDKHLKPPARHQKLDHARVFPPTGEHMHYSQQAGVWEFHLCLSLIGQRWWARGDPDILLAEGGNVNSWHSLSCGIQTGNRGSEF